MKTKISFSQPPTESGIICDAGIFAFELASILDKGFSRVFAIIDRNVYTLYSATLLKPLTEVAGIHIFPSGEENKSFDNARHLLQWLLSEGADRSSLLVGVGGGVVTDIAGYVAANFMRGLAFVAVATTLVGQVDAAIGGKTAVNLDRTKNIVGTFHFPSMVICDSEFLPTLEESHRRDGLVEAFKIFAAYNRESWQEECSKLDAYLAGENLLSLVSRAASLKCQVVNEDPFERDLRQVLNFGHTTGHAIETEADCSHGQAVALGILVALELSRELSSLSNSEAREIEGKFRTIYSLHPAPDFPPARLWARIQRDKKKQGADINFVLLKSCGEHVVKTVDYQQFSAAYDVVSRRLTE